MHQYVTGQWAASAYSTGGARTDYMLFLSPDGTFGWTESGGRQAMYVGNWRHGPDEDVLTLNGTDDMGQPVAQRWTIHYVSDCEDSNCILVLRWLGLGGRNLPILFHRTHVPEHVKWPARPSE